MRDELLSLPRHRRARRFFTRALREQDELLELYDRREARGGVLHPEAQRRFEQHFTFPSYTPAEIGQVFVRRAWTQGFSRGPARRSNVLRVGCPDAGQLGG